MNKFLKSKKWGIILIILISILSILGLINTNFEPKYSISQNDQAIIITLENGQYIALRPEADYIEDSTNGIIKPFGGLNGRVFKSTGINYFFLRKSYFQEITSFDNTRLLSIQPIDQHSFILRYKINTNTDSDSRSNYNLQIDYSSNAEFLFGNKNFTINDGVCQTTIINEGIGEIEKLAQFPSVILSQQYSTSIEFTIKIENKCSK